MIQSCPATFRLIVACGGAGSGTPWRPWDVGGCHGWWVHDLASFYLFFACRDVSTIQKSCQCGPQDFAYVDNIKTWYKKPHDLHFTQRSPFHKKKIGSTIFIKKTLQPKMLV